MGGAHVLSSGADGCGPAAWLSLAAPDAPRGAAYTASQAGAVEAPDAALDRTLAFLRVVKYTPPTDW